MPTVLDAAAFGVPDSHGITRVCAAIVSRVHIDDAVLSDFCAHALPRISPTTILRMKALPRNENGKLMREQLVDIALHLARRPSGWRCQKSSRRPRECDRERDRTHPLSRAPDARRRRDRHAGWHCDHVSGA